MIEVKVDVRNQMSGQLRKIKQELAKVPQQGLVQFRALTPIRSGNARRNTYLDRDTIRADYPYAQRLDQGWSKQAPQGIVRPWEQWLRNRIRQIMGR